MKLPQEIYSVKAVRDIDRRAIDVAGISGYTLMTRAAQSAFEYARAAFPDARRWQIVCGAGNNAGDGYVLARLAGEQGVAVSVIALVNPDALSGDAAIAYGDFAASGGLCTAWEGHLDNDAGLVVEALLGSGLCRPVDGEFADAIDAINAHPAPVLALDIPGGIDGDSGKVLGAAVKADLTVTFVGLKAGLFLADGIAHAGKLEFSDLAIPAECRAEADILMRRIEYSAVSASLGRRARDAHKGDFGHLVVIGGGPGMPGAVALAGEAALRSGAGRVSVATHPEHASVIASSRHELMCHGIAGAAQLQALLDRATTLALGPGLGTTDWGRELFDVAIDAGLPMVVDADALNLLAQIDRRAENWVLTPHPGEAARLLETSSADVQKDRLVAIQGLGEKFGGTIVLKGAGTLVNAATGAPWVCTSGNPGMAAPGMGDVLTGVIGGLLAQGLDPERAAVCGVEIHARAGDLAAKAGERGMLAGDLMPHIRRWVNPA